jgi:DNA-binding transcriptional LysR family regulator
MLDKGVTLRALEVFEAVARTGSVAGAAAALKLSLPAVSQQLTNLEATLGGDLIDRARRPMRLTPAGRVYLARVEPALRQIRQAQAEVAVMDLAHLADLRLGTIDDFDAEITPQLVIALAKNLVNCRFRLTTGPSHEISRMLMAGQLDVVICAAPRDGAAGLAEQPLLRDPYVLAVPKHFVLPKGGELAALSTLPLLRYDRDQFMGRQIETQLSRLRIDLPDRFELDSNQSILGLVASGAGWSITTPLAYLRARQFVAQVDVHPLPFAGFSRTISLFSHGDQMGRVASDIAQRLRLMLGTAVLEPARAMVPWLGNTLAILPPND